MISANYILNGREESVFNDELFTCEKFLDDSLNEFNIEYINFCATVESTMLESSIMGVLPDEETNIFIEKAKKNVIQKLGDTLIEMGKKFIEFIEKKITETKNFFFKYKNNEKKLAELIKKHPELGKEKIQNICADGALELSDIKSLAELDTEFEKIAKMARASEDPDALDVKWEQAKKKCLGKNYKSDGALSNTTKVVGAAAGVITLAVAIKTFGPKMAEANKNIQEEKQRQQKENAIIYDILHKDNDSNIDNVGRHRKLLAMDRERMGFHMRAIGREQNFITKAQDLFASILDKIEGKKGDEKFNNFNANNHAVMQRLNQAEMDKARLAEQGKRAAR